MEDKNIKKHTDKYFSRAKEILEAENLNPWVTARVFTRGKGNLPDLVEEAKFIYEAGNLKEVGGEIWMNNSTFLKETTPTTLMKIVAPIQNIIELETIYLGNISERLSIGNEYKPVNMGDVKKKAQNIRNLVGEEIPISYFGARHWGIKYDLEIARAAIEGGFNNCSTDNGAHQFGMKGLGTIPHILENCYAFIYGRERAVVEATKAFDRIIDPNIKRIALVDYNNKEIDDSLKVCMEVPSTYALRIDTCGENTMQGAEQDLVKRVKGVPDEFKKYWSGKGVSVSGVYALRKSLNDKGYSDVKLILTSGFGDEEKLKAFIDSEEKLETKLIGGLGIGGLFDSMTSSMDVVRMGYQKDSQVPISKVGREETEYMFQGLERLI